MYIFALISYSYILVLHYLVDYNIIATGSQKLKISNKLHYLIESI